MLGGYYNLHTNDKCSKDIFSENNRATFPKNIAAHERATVISAFSTNDELTTQF